MKNPFTQMFYLLGCLIIIAVSIAICFHKKDYSIELIHYKSVAIEKYVKQFEFDKKSDKYSSVKFLKYYITDEYGEEHEIEKIQFDTIHLKGCATGLPDSIELMKCDKSYEIK